MQPVTIHGALVATTVDILGIKRRNDKSGEEREHMPSWAFLKNLDPDGTHILCTRGPFEGEGEEVDSGHWQGNMTLGSSVHFEGLFKFKGQHAPTRQWITLTVAEVITLEPAPIGQVAATINLVDGETQVR
jgi:hypothetical protein